MKEGLTITEMAAEIERQNAVKEDYLVNTQSLEMESMGGPPMLRVVENGIDQMMPLTIQETAHRQMGAYLNIPWKYYERMHAEDPDLLSYNVNRWLRKEAPTQRMLRTIDGKARAFLSNRYRCLDNFEIAGTTLPIIAEMQDARFESCQLTEDFMYIKVVNPKVTGEVRVGDVVQAGVVISNSETGLGAVSIKPLIYRLVCSNGMVVDKAKMRRNHVGKASSMEENFQLYSEKTLKADREAFLLKVRDTVRSAVDEAQFSEVLKLMKDSTEAKLNIASIPSVVKLTGSNFGITEAESEGVFQHLIEDGDYTLYGLANAVTRFSQDVEDYDRASKLECIGYNVMTMPPAMFKQINQVTSIAA